MRLGLACLALSALVIAGFWAWLGAPIAIPASPLSPGEKLYCLSYAPFRPGQSPLDPNVHVTPEQIDEDMSRLARITDCVRTYSVDYGQDQIAPIAARHGLKVIQGLWLSSHADTNRKQVDTVIALANRYPDTIRAIVVGNEVLLRGEMSADQLVDTIRTVKARVPEPVTYADVWEFWLRNRDVAAAADFITIHILPYWEDFPIPAREAAAHVEAIRRRMVAAFPGKEVVIGEVGWPSEGRMREGALPSPANEARVIEDVLALAKRENFRVNIIEAFDQSWKRALEGTVGGHWGVFDNESGQPKFAWGEPVSNHPLWRWQAAGGVVFALLVFAVAFRMHHKTRPRLWVATTANAIVGGGLIGWSIADVPVQSLGVGGWLQSIGYAGVAFLAPLVLSGAVMRGAPLPRFSRLLGPLDQRVDDRLARLVVAVLIATTLMALLSALGLVFNPRYRDFPFAALTAAIVPFFTHSITMPRPPGRYGAAEWTAGGILALAVPYIALNEGLANWQSLWLCGALLLLAVTLARVRDVPG